MAHQDDEEADSVIAEGNRNNQQLPRTVFFYFDLELLYNPIVLTRVVYSIGSAYSFIGWIIYLVPFAIDIGISSYRAASLSAIGGIGNLLGNATFPLLKKKLSNEHILYLTTLIGSLSLVVCPLFSSTSSYTALTVPSFIFGYSRGLGILASQHIAKENIEEDKITNTFTWLFVAFSIGSVTSGFFSGWIYDQTGSYTVSFLLLGLFALLSVGPQPFVDSKRNQKKSHQYSRLSPEDDDRQE
ncbi:monocarboxylate transporter 12-like [Amphiura filiformis]|uniref:monocarboxylate transporter 12-like n=1 Tax=Amphiura filiformis TaxID=82378 RepID=UPI003B21EE58